LECIEKESHANAHKDLARASELDITSLQKFAKCLEDFKVFQKMPYLIKKDPSVFEYLKQCRYVPIDQLRRLADQSGPPTNIRLSKLIEKKETIERHPPPWYFGMIDRAEAESILAECKFNAFLLRRNKPGSPHPGGFPQQQYYIVSLKKEGDSQATHKIIQGYDIWQLQITFQKRDFGGQTLHSGWSDSL
jgi:hypothetical protein